MCVVVCLRNLTAGCGEVLRQTRDGQEFEQGFRNKTFHFVALTARSKVHLSKETTS